MLRLKTNISACWCVKSSELTVMRDSSAPRHGSGRGKCGHTCGSLEHMYHLLVSANNLDKALNLILFN